MVADFETSSFENHYDTYCCVVFGLLFYKIYVMSTTKLGDVKIRVCALVCFIFHHHHHHGSLLAWHCVAVIYNLILHSAGYQGSSED